jgi:hypothetical protein
MIPIIIGQQISIIPIALNRADNGADQEITMPPEHLEN